MIDFRLNFLCAPAVMSLVLSACTGGGGGGGGVNSISPPPAPPGPPPPPPPPPPPHSISNIFPGITVPTDFAVLGIHADTIPAASITTSGFSVRYDGTGYVFDFPSTDPASLVVNSESAAFWNGYFATGGSSFPGYYGSVFKPSATNPELALTYTSFVTYFDYDYDDYAPVGFVAFGSATAPGSVPTTGSATYGAIVKGLTLDDWNQVGGTATLSFNFGTGNLTGSMNPVIFDGTAVLNPGTYSFVNTVFGIGSTTFSGQLQLTNAPSLGAFNGLFTGPAAQELMARWNAPYQNQGSGQWSGMAGIWVGKKQ